MTSLERRQTGPVRSCFSQVEVVRTGVEQGDDLEALIETCRLEAETGDGDARFRLEIWQTTLVRIRRIEALMKDKQAPRG